MQKMVMAIAVLCLGFSGVLYALDGKCVSGNCINGEGTMEYQIPNTKYIGQWKDGKRHGQGTMTYPDGGKYTGQWKNDKRDGKGKMSYYKGDTYSGEWKEGKNVSGREDPYDSL